LTGSIRRILHTGVAGTAAALALTIGGAIPGMASAAVPTATPSADFATTSMGPQSAAHPASPLPRGNPGEFDVFDESNSMGNALNLGNRTAPNWVIGGLSSAVYNTQTSMCLYAGTNFQGFFVFVPKGGGFVDQFDPRAHNISSVRPSPDGQNC
jgi:hypothetical protein